MSTTELARQSAKSVRPAAVLAASVVLLTVLIVSVSALGTELLGLPTTYGGGIDSRLGPQAKADFLADQDAEAKALSTGDQTVLGGRLSDSALADVIQQISSQSGAGTPPAVTFQPASLSILRAPDPADPSLTIEVQEDGTRTVVTNNGPNAVPTEQAISFHGDFWLRKPSGGHYTIADQQMQNQPSSPLPAIALAVAALLFVGLATILVMRQRTHRPALAGVPAVVPLVARALVAMPPDGAEPEPPRPPSQMTIATFGGLHIRAAGQDWAQALLSRPVTGFVCLRLLVAAIRDPGSQVSRDEVARNASPGLSRDVQLKRLRNVIAKGLREMPPVLRDRILVTPEAMRFELEGCEVDAIDLLTLSTATSSRPNVSSNEVAQLHRVVSACQGAFLPEFETIEDLATDRHPTCTQMVSELRESLTNKRVDVALLLADAYLRTGQQQQAVAALEPALSDRPERKDLADRLAGAYRAAGREAEARALEAPYS